MRLTSWLSTRPGTLLRYLLSLVVLGWLFYQVRRAGWNQLTCVDWTLAAPAVLLALLAYPLQAWRWQILLRALGIDARTGWVHAVFWIGNFFNAFLPGGIAGDAVRLAHVWKENPGSRARGAASLLLDRLIGLAALAALASASVGIYTLTKGSINDSGFRTLLPASLGFFIALFAVVWSLLRTRFWEPVSTRLLSADRARALHDAAVALGEKHSALAFAVLLSLVVWLLDFLSLYLLAKSVGLETSGLTMAVAASAAYLAAILPISIGGHGVREGALVATLLLLGVGHGQGAQTSVLAILFLALTLFSSLLGGIVFLAKRPVSGSTAEK